MAVGKVASGAGSPPSNAKLQQEVSDVLRSVADPNALTFKQVRLAVEQSLGLPEGSLHKDSKSRIKAMVHAVMDEIDAEADDEDTSSLHASDSTRAGGATVKGNGKSTSLKKEKKDGKPTTATALHEESGTAKAKSRKRKLDAADVSVAQNGKGKGPDRSTSKSSTKAGTRAGDAGGKPDEDENVVCVLSRTKANKRQVSVKTWKGNVQVKVHLPQPPDRSIADCDEFKLVSRDDSHVTLLHVMLTIRPSEDVTPRRFGVVYVAGMTHQEVDIREFYQDKETDEYKPGRKGITLSPSQWRELCESMDAVDSMLD